MELKRGRLIDHVHLRSRDLEAAKAFYASEEYLAARQSREHAAKMNMIVVEGV